MEVIAILRWLVGPVGRYVAGALLLLAVLGWFKYDTAKDAITAAKARMFEQEVGRVHKSVKADDEARRCAADPSCRLRDDGWRRD